MQVLFLILYDSTLLELNGEKYSFGMIEELLTEDISRIFAELNSSEAETEQLDNYSKELTGKSLAEHGLINLLLQELKL